jgi:hypothetical protein
MATRTYHGSCHCGAVTFEAEIDLAQGTGKCNCRLCWKTRKWGIGVKPAAFRLLTGQEALTDYFKHEAVHNPFCRSCGVRTHSWGNIPEIGGEYVSISLACLDDLDPSELAEANVRFMDGRADNWFSTPAETRHL